MLDDGDGDSDDEMGSLAAYYLSTLPKDRQEEMLNSVDPTLKVRLRRLTPRRVPPA